MSKKALGPGRSGRGNRVWENWKREVQIPIWFQAGWEGQLPKVINPEQQQSMKQSWIPALISGYQKVWEKQENKL